MLEGIDTSNYQGQISWREAHNSGLSFGIVKATEGTEFTDQCFGSSWQQLHDLGMPRAAYHFFYDHIDPVSQVEFFHDHVRSQGRFHYGDAVMIDVEEVGVTNAGLCVDNLKTFIRRVWHDIDKPIGIYTNGDTWLNLLGNPDDELFRRCFLWQGSLGPGLAKLAPWPKGPSFLQYSWTGRIPGVSTPVDLDRFFGTLTQLRKLFRARQ